MKSRNSIRTIAIIIISCNIMTSCGKTQDAITINIKTESPIIEQTELAEIPEATVTAEKDLSNMEKSKLTGEYINKEYVNKRPVAVMINNIKQALPQSGIGSADIYYETLAEGGITRIMAIYQKPNDEKIGPVRSARDYYINIANEYDAVFVHHGGSTGAYVLIRGGKIDDLDGMNLEGTYFWRDQDRYKIPKMREHSSYTDGADMDNAITTLGIRENWEEGFTLPFNFSEEKIDPVNGEIGNKITIPFSNSQNSVFEYDDITKSYIRSQNGESQIDDQTNRQLTVTNILVEKTYIGEISGDDKGRQQIKLTGEGDGYFFSNGKYAKVKWKKDGNQTKWYYDDGSEIILNSGKSWICIFPENHDIIVE